MIDGVGVGQQSNAAARSPFAGFLAQMKLAMAMASFSMLWSLESGRLRSVNRNTIRIVHVQPVFCEIVVGSHANLVALLERNHVLAWSIATYRLPPFIPIEDRRAVS